MRATPSVATNAFALDVDLHHGIRKHAAVVRLEHLVAVSRVEGERVAMHSIQTPPLRRIRRRHSRVSATGTHRRETSIGGIVYEDETLEGGRNRGVAREIRLTLIGERAASDADQLECIASETAGTRRLSPWPSRSGRIHRRWQSVARFATRDADDAEQRHDLGETRLSPSQSAGPLQSSLDGGLGCVGWQAVRAATTAADGSGGSPGQCAS